MNLDVQSVLTQQQQARRSGRALEPGEPRLIAQPRAAELRCRLQPAVAHPVASDIAVRTAGERKIPVEKIPAVSDHPFAAHRIKGHTALRTIALGNHIGTVERVVQASPARIGRVEGIARVADRYHQLRPGNRGDLRIDVFGAHREIRPVGDPIADLAQQRQVIRAKTRGAGELAVPSVQPLLQGIAPREQRRVDRCEFPQQLRQAWPEPLRRDAGAGQGFLVDEAPQFRCDLGVGRGQQIIPGVHVVHSSA